MELVTEFTGDQMEMITEFTGDQMEMINETIVEAIMGEIVVRIAELTGDWIRD